MKNILIWVFILFLVTELKAQQLVINEICAKNQNVLPDYEGDFPDWIELYNGTDTTINLLGYRLSDKNDGDPFWVIPAPLLLAPDDFLIIFASGKNDFINAQFHSDFSISSDGETISLLSPEGSFLDIVDSPAMDIDQSYGRSIDGELDWILYAQPTPDASNVSGLPAYEITFSHPQGFYEDSLFLMMSAESGLDIRYTTDGRIPTAIDSLYTTPLLLKDKANEPNVYSEIPSTPTPYVPADTIDKFNILRIAAFFDGVRVSSIYNRTYAIGEKPLLDNFPIVSIIVEPDDFFGDSLGLWVNGTSFYNGGSANYSNLGEEWERPISLAFFDEDKSFDNEQGAGIRIHGNGPRTGAHKSMRLYGRNKYGKSHLTHSLIGGETDEYKRLVLRTVRFNVNDTYFADELGATCLINNNVLGQEYRMVLVYINGEYWGIYGLKTRIDKFHLEAEYDIDQDNVDLLFANTSNIKAGDAEAFLSLQAFLDTADLSIEEQYLYIQTLVDVDNFINYLISMFYIENTDWPGNNNYFFKEKNDSSKWQWAGVDHDFAFKDVNRNMIDRYLNADTPANPANITLLGRKLFENETFVNEFILSFEDRLNTIYKVDTLVPIVLDFYDLYKPHFLTYLDRYNYANTNSFEEWHNKVNWVIYFLSFRPCVIKEQISEYFGYEIDLPDCELYVVDTSQIIIPEIISPLVEQSPNDGSVPDVEYYEPIIKVNTGLPFLSEMNKPMWYLNNGYLYLDETFDEASFPLTLAIYDANGKRVYDDKIGLSEKVNFIALPKGIYILQTQTANAIFYQKIMK